MSVISPVFSRMLSGAQIEAHAMKSLKQWFPTYLREFERQADIKSGSMMIPRNYDDRNTFDMESGEQLPKVVVIAPGIVGTPSKDGSGQYTATWRLGVGIAIAGNTEEHANKLVKGYGAVIRAIMLQNSGMGEIGGIDIRWTDESYDDIDLPNQTRLLKAASLYFDIDFTNVVTRRGGPTVPDQAPDSYDYGEVELVDIELQKL